MSGDLSGPHEDQHGGGGRNTANNGPRVPTTSADGAPATAGVVAGGTSSGTGTKCDLRRVYLKRPVIDELPQTGLREEEVSATIMRKAREVVSANLAQRK